MKLYGTLARRIAEKQRGKGGTSTEETNRPGFYYYSCSSHGGYAVDTDFLTAEEKERLNDERKITVACYEVDGILRKAKIDQSYKEEKEADGYFGKQKIFNKTFYLYEEDNARAVIEYVTGVRRVGHETKGDKRMRNNLYDYFQKYLKPEDKEKAERIHTEIKREGQERFDLWNYYKQEAEAYTQAIPFLYSY